jgi:TrpR-related protein YerC/YecD
MMSLKHNEQNDQLFRSILSLESIDECYEYFEDLCTIKEVIAIAQRLEVARMLADGQSYQQTIAHTGASSATISRVKRCLDDGAGGYALVLERMGDEQAAQEGQEPS